MRAGGAGVDAQRLETCHAAQPLWQGALHRLAEVQHLERGQAGQVGQAAQEACVDEGEVVELDEAAKPVREWALPKQGVVGEVEQAEVGEAAQRSRERARQVVVQQVEV